MKFFSSLRRPSPAFLVFLVVVALVIAWITYLTSPLPRWFATHPQYEGTVRLEKIKSEKSEGDIRGVGPKQLEELVPTRIPESVQHPPVPATLASRRELSFPYRTYGDTLGNFYIAVREQAGEAFVSEICKIYKVEEGELRRVREIPTDTWCSYNVLVTDYKGNWLTFPNSRDGGETYEVYKVEGTKAWYLPQFAHLPSPMELFYNEEAGALYLLTRPFIREDSFLDSYFEKTYYKVTFEP